MLFASSGRESDVQVRNAVDRDARLTKLYTAVALLDLLENAREESILRGPALLAVDHIAHGVVHPVFVCQPPSLAERDISAPSSRITAP